ncbi:MAG: hypothetical protein LBN32_03520 [Helicobacteraceae bacterium]|jgi:cell division transport system permease protein|nr:hypothetical protein [Helicobacteraceae bacterium]
MKSIKNHFSLIFALTALLMNFQTYMVITGIITKYETNLSDDYAIVILSKERLNIENIKRVIPYSRSLDQIDTAQVIEEVKETLSENNLAYLKTAMPHFYRLKLNHYPSIDERSQIAKELSDVNSIIRVETFAKTENKVYKLLLLNKAMILVFAVLMFIVALLMIVRQMEVWRHEHTRRISIMTIFGAPMWHKSAVLFRLAIIDSIISAALVGGLFYYISVDSGIKLGLIEVGLSEIEYNPFISVPILFGLALTISIASTLYVIFNAEERNE